MIHDLDLASQVCRRCGLTALAIYHGSWSACQLRAHRSPTWELNARATAASKMDRRPAIHETIHILAASLEANLPSEATPGIDVDAWQRGGEIGVTLKINIVENEYPGTCPDCGREDAISSVLRDGGSTLYCAHCRTKRWRNPGWRRGTGWPGPKPARRSDTHGEPKTPQIP